MAAPFLRPIEGGSGRLPLVSFVVPTYRRPHQIGETLEALLAQTCGDFEVLVRDDSPNDETERVVKSYYDSRVQYYRNPERLGMPGNLNSGISATRGRFIAVCHDHDLHVPERLEKLLGLFSEFPDLAFAHTGLAIIKEDGTASGVQNVGHFERYTEGHHWLRTMLSTFSCPVAADTLVPRSVYEKHGLYDPDYGFISDVEIWMRFCLAGGVGYLAEPLSRLREREADHAYSGVRWDIIDTISCIHRIYHKKAYTGFGRFWREVYLSLRLDGYVSSRYLYCVRNKDEIARSAGKKFIRQNSYKLSTAVSMFL